MYLWAPDGSLRIAGVHGVDDWGAAEAAGTTVASVAKRTERISTEPEGDLGGPWSPAAGVRAVLLSPLLARNAPLGALVVARTGDGAPPFGRDDRRVAEALASQAAQLIDSVRRAEEQRTALRRMREHGERREDHVAGLTHDLRSPLTALLGYVRTLRTFDGTLSPEERTEFLDIMERQIRRLSGLVDDLLLGARLDAGRLRPDEVVEVDLGDLVAVTCALLAPTHRARVVVDARAPAAVRGDRRQLERVLQNLVDNALTHNPAATRVTVCTDRAGDEALLTVHDDGPPIPPPVLGDLFTRFGGAQRRRSGSTGLGLYTARGIVEGHRGRISVRSDDVAGTTFEVRLPAAPPAA